MDKDSLRSHIVTSRPYPVFRTILCLNSRQGGENLKSQIDTSSWGGTKYPPMAFTEQGVAMLSSVLGSERAIMEFLGSST